MKIDYAFMSTDTNPVDGKGNPIDPNYYLGLWPLVSAAWRKIGIKPILLKIVENPSDFKDDPEEGIYYLPIVKDYPEFHHHSVRNFQSMTARIWGWSMFEGNGIITDLDMMPLHSDYFNKTAEGYTDENVIAFTADAKEKFGNIGACYVLANSKVAREFFATSDYVTWIKETAQKTGQLWGGEQGYLEQLVAFAGSNAVNLKRGFNSAGQADARLDRDNWRYANEDVKRGLYFDAHLPRPYSEYKETIDNLLSLL